MLPNARERRRHDLLDLHRQHLHWWVAEAKRPGVEVYGQSPAMLCPRSPASTCRCSRRQPKDRNWHSAAPLNDYTLAGQSENRTSKLLVTASCLMMRKDRYRAAGSFISHSPRPRRAGPEHRTAALIARQRKHASRLTGLLSLGTSACSGFKIGAAVTDAWRCTARVCLSRTLAVVAL